MMLWHRNFSVTAGEIPRIHREVQGRFRGGQADWERCRKILQATYLTDHLLLKENAERELSFPSLKMAEFFAGLYLGRYCDERVIQELQPEIGRGEWNNVWRFVAELPETTDSSGKTLCSVVSMSHSLQALFAVPDKGNLRPTESMFRAWQVFTRNAWLSEVREQVLTGWRQQFRRILIEGYEQGKPSQRARTAAEVVFEGDLTAFVDSAVDPELARLRSRLDELEAIKRPDRKQKAELQTLTARYAKLDELKIEDWCQQLRPSFDTYALCSDAKKGDPEQLTFMMGASAEDMAAHEDEKPWQKVPPIPAFYMATACVTRAQYRLFDAQRENVDSDFSEISPDPGCPMIYVNFHDGICFALWLDDRYSLPSEVQWEGAAWGGLDRKQHQDYVIGVPPYTAKFTSAEVNFDGNYPLEGPKSEYRQRTVPVRFAEFQPNGFGLWQMSGNVYEYTRSEWHGRLQDAIEHREDNLACGSAEASRCVRGGSWNLDAWSTRCSIRYRLDIRYISTGIRLSRTK
jgi:formylglycine-generating enzyme required for sulfatase activity